MEGATHTHTRLHYTELSQSNQNGVHTKRAPSRILGTAWYPAQVAMVLFGAEINR